MAILQQMRNPFKMGLHFFLKLPSCWFWGVRVQSIDLSRAVIALPFSWRTQNPFRSTYFAAQLGAAELSTGLLCMAALADKPPISMLITGVNAKFVKKAKATVYFTCDQGDQLAEVLDRVAAGTEGEELALVSVGKTAEGVVVCEATFQWSFRKK
ncbi:MAG: DUF4442 domain-containing protein [Saprospiraceae bacterium]|jgi:hypothetical protein|nr:DUF4442 domain-containing protein [Saprospiraceae bacterium]MDP4999482.1 DUF4442 domain-containing protein [Saprospiraceae bacterium]